MLLLKHVFPVDVFLKELCYLYLDLILITWFRNFSPVKICFHGYAQLQAITVPVTVSFSMPSVNVNKSFLYVCSFCTCYELTLLSSSKCYHYVERKSPFLVGVVNRNTFFFN